jgi:ribosomal protein S24E
MEVLIKEEKENIFLNRKELKLEVKHEKSATPSKQELTKALASMFNVQEQQVLIDYILTKKGCCVSFAKAKILKEPKEVKSEAQTSKSA